MLILEFIAITLRALWLNATLSVMIAGIIYMLCSFGTGIFYMITGIRLIRMLKKFASVKNKEKRSTYVRLSNYILATGIFQLMFGTATIIAASPGYSYPAGYNFMEWYAFTTISVVSLLHVAVFVVAKEASTSSNSTKGPNSGNSTTSTSANVPMESHMEDEESAKDSPKDNDEDASEKQQEIREQETDDDKQESEKEEEV